MNANCDRCKEPKEVHYSTFGYICLDCSREYHKEVMEGEDK